MSTYVTFHWRLSVSIESGAETSVPASTPGGLAHTTAVVLSIVAATHVLPTRQRSSASSCACACTRRDAMTHVREETREESRQET